MEIRNIAIIAHVDHGKTTITNSILRQTGMADDSVNMDSNALELERGITIYSKNTSINYKGTKINIVDTPGHADFSSEVERVLRSIDSVLLVVDAQEGPMPQTKFVLKKSLEIGLKPIVVINKIDKPAADPVGSKELVYELFLDLGANDEQLDFTTVYAIGKQGLAKRELTDETTDMTPLLDAILEKVKATSGDELSAKPLRMQPFNLAYDNYVGRLAIGRIYEGVVRANSNVVVKKDNGDTRTGKVTKLYTFSGLKKVEVEQAEAGDIVMVAGLPDIYIGETICDNVDQEPLPAIHIDEPTISLNFVVNNSPFAGKEGKYVTTRQIRERLEKELEVNVGLKVDFDEADRFKVYGRGELHIAILLENLRREGFEVQVSQPQVILKQENGVTTEPFEEVLVNVPENMTGIIIEKLSKRKGMMTGMKPEHGTTRLTFEIPTRGLLGYRGEFTIDTRGEGILCARFIGFRPHVGTIERHDVGSMISMAQGSTAAFALDNLQTRGVLYVGPGVEVYEGMVVGNTSKGDDMTVNPIKGKQLTNMRTTASDAAIILAPAFELSLERGLEVMKDDEYLEVTPKNIRLRKMYLNDTERAKARNKAAIV